jgi:hypothetical protein
MSAIQIELLPDANDDPPREKIKPEYRMLGSCSKCGGAIVMVGGLLGTKQCSQCGDVPVETKGRAE